jgi:hypothetical protein
MKKRLVLLPLLALPMLAAADSGSGSGSSSTAQLLAGLFQGCWACGAFNTVGAIGLDFADKAFSQLASGMTILIGLFMALWVLYFAAKLFLPFGPPGAAHWNMGAGKVMKLIFVLAFLQTSGPFWDYIFTPILSTGLGIASQLATATDSYERNFGASGGVPGGSGASNGATDYCAGPIPATQITGLSASAQQGLTALEQMDCPLSKMQGQFGKGIMIGVAVIGQMGCSKSWLPNILPSNSAIAFLAAGLVLIVVYLFGFLVFPFLLIDVLAKIILVAATSPLAIASILFKPTARIAERAVWSLLHAGLTLMFGAATAGIGKALIAYILQQMSTNGGPTLTDWSSLQSSLENSCAQGFNVDFSTASFYMLVGTGIITIFMMRRAGALATELTGAAQGGTGAQTGLAAIVGGAAGAAGRMGQMAYQQMSGAAKSRKSAQVTGNDKG